jgi:sterol desaturase/sphingolipid hydroxylase (fatty acid hydroxylase superfamily)
MAKKYVSNKDVSVRIFRSDVLEWFTHVHPLLPHVLYVPLIAVMLYVSAANGVAPGRIALLFLGGVMLWTIAEYFVHRFAFHAGPKIEDEVREIVAALPQGDPALGAMKTFRQRHYFLAHGVHHDFPNDTRRLVMPPSVSVPLAVVFFVLYTQMLGMADGPAVFAGFTLGYLVYDSIHYAVHHFTLRAPVLSFLKKQHLRHHYQDSTKDFGVSSPVWDLVMGTFGKAARG